MNIKFCLSQTSVSTPSAYVWRYYLTLLLTLTLSIFFTTPSYADKDLNKNADVVNFTSTSTSSANTSAFAQTFIMPTDGKAVSHTIIDCNAKNEFVDDGILYKDETGNPRNDTLSICPNSQWQTIKVEFTKFDLAIGDTLHAFDGNLQALRDGKAPLIGKSRGVGVSKAFGGWAVSSCSPEVNPSGCLTFVFTTNGDYVKSIGWEAWATCADRNIVLTPPSIRNPILKCSEVSRIHTIGAATVTADCGTISNDSTYVRITNTAGVVCIDTCLSKNKNMVITKEFALGTYLVTYKLKSDITKTTFAYFSISEPSLVCNDRLSIPLDFSCSVVLSPDMILESPCDTISGFLYYKILVKTIGGKVLTEGTGKEGDLPILTREMLSLCADNDLEVEVKRIYYEGVNLPFCNNGRQESSCSAIVRFKDNSPPLFKRSISTDTIYVCDPALSEVGLMLTSPEVVDNCSETQVYLKEVVELNAGVANSCSAEVTYLAIWNAKDDCGNVAILKDTVRVLRPGRDKIVKIADTYLSCSEDSPYSIDNFGKTGIPGIMVGRKKNGQFIPTDTIDLSTTEYVCKYILKKEDKRFPSSCGEKYFRFWTLVDWCNTIGPVAIDTQLIEFTDTLAPVFQCSAYNTVYNAEQISLPHFECTKNVYLSAPLATDNCDLLPKVQMFIVERLENGGWWKIANNLGQAGALPAGTFRVGYRASDVCPNQIKEDTCFRYFILEDLTKPTAICQDVLNVSLSNDLARIQARDIDAGSWDACGIEKVLIRRAVCNAPDVWQGATNFYVKNKLNNKLDATGWAEYIDFACCDLHQRVKVELLVIDENGNYNYCWMEIVPEDKINPYCADLPNRTDYCDNFHSGELGAASDTDGDKQFDYNEWIDLEGDLVELYNQKYGTPYSVCTDNLTCQNYTIEQDYQLLDLECGIYKIKRRYRARDLDGNVSNWAEQYITIEYRANWQVTLPVDWTGTCGDGVPEESLIIENGACDLMSYEAYDQEFEIVNDACFKVIRTYHIINWCKYKAGDEPINISRIANNKGEVVNSRTLTSAQFGNFSYLKYIQILKVADTEAPHITINEVDNCLSNPNGCTDTRNFSASATDCNEASNEKLDYQWEIFEYNNRIGSGYGKNFNWVVSANSSYKVKWRVADKCGNSAWAEKVYTFNDCKKPSPYCLNGLALELGTSVTAEIWAKDFDINSSDNCSPADRLSLRIWHHSLSNELPTNLEDVYALPSALSLGCTYLGTQQVYIYVIDEAGNYDFCITNMIIQDNMNVCPTTGGKIAGKIYTSHGETVQNTEVTVMDNASMMTAADGNYSFDLSGSSAYTIVPNKNTQILNGVSTYDLVKITKHILGKELFDSPYQYIAADANASGEISTFDIIVLRKLILNLTDKLPEGTNSWRFIPASYEFKTDKPLEENFPEQIQINNLSSNLPNLDFVAVKIGDINGNAATNNLIESKPRNAEGSLIIEIEDRPVKAGQTIEVVFHTGDFSAIEGYQFTLQFKGLDLMAFDEGVAKASNFGFTLQKRGYLTTSWNGLAVPTKDSNLFRLTFKATTSGSLLSLLEINSKYTAAEAYRNDGALLDVALKAKQNTPLHTAFSLQQNKPNPFTNSTLIGFELPEMAMVRLNIIDLQGRLVHTQEGEFGQGLQQITINADDLESGTYYYQVITPFGMDTKKMIVID